MGRYRSGQTGSSVKALSFDFEGSNPSRPTLNNIIYKKNVNPW